jgi:hypothetical protein
MRNYFIYRQRATNKSVTGIGFIAENEFTGKTKISSGVKHKKRARIKIQPRFKIQYPMKNRIIKYKCRSKIILALNQRLAS